MSTESLPLDLAKISLLGPFHFLAWGKKDGFLRERRKGFWERVRGACGKRRVDMVLLLPFLFFQREVEEAKIVGDKF